MLARRLRQEVGRQNGWIPDRLGERAGHQVERPFERRIVGRDHVVQCRDGARHGLSVAALIVARIRKLDGVGVDPLPRHYARGGCRKQGGIKAAAREHAHGNVRHQLPLDRLEQDVPHLVG